MTYLGIDFSGDANKWKPKVSVKTVWVAKVRQGTLVNVEWLRSIQDFPGSEPPFQRLANFLRCGDYVAAGIDAPFSIPKQKIPTGGWHALIEAVDKLPLDGRPFPAADKFLDMVNGEKQERLFRETEQHWKQYGVNVRSTLWWKHRGGAPFTAACMKLIASTGQPCWPWASGKKGTLVEAFPAAQLCQWKFNQPGYGDPKKGGDARNRIIDCLSSRIEFGAWEALARQCPDALDAVVAAFAAIAVNARAVAWPAGRDINKLPIHDEGWIAVHR